MVSTEVFCELVARWVLVVACLSSREATAAHFSTVIFFFFYKSMIQFNQKECGCRKLTLGEALVLTGIVLAGTGGGVL